MPQAALAGTHTEAQNAISTLRASVRDNSMLDEIKSLETTFALAEKHRLTGDSESSEKYYLLTIQKARILTSATRGLPPATTEHSTPIETSSKSRSVRQSSAVQASVSSASDGIDSVLESADLSESFYSDKLVGNISSYSVNKGDTIRLVAAKLGVSRQLLLKMNRLNARSTLQIGQKLKYNNRKIIPMKMRDGIIVNIPDRTLYYFQKGKLVRSLPVALGTVNKSDKYDWQTPTGKFRITEKKKEPTWYVPPSIQAEMEEEGKEVIESIPPGPDNPLGKYAIKTSIPGILIHSTIKPWSIYSFASHGCIRVYPEQMEELFREVRVNTPGEIIYRPVKLAVTEDGRIFLEVHHDVYSKSTGLSAEAKALIETNQLADRIDWNKFESVVRQKLGIAEDITL